MTETPSGNRWEPGASAGLQPAPDAPTPSAAASDPVPVEWPPPPSYDVPVTGGRDGRRGRRRGLLVAGAALVVLASGATGYAIGSSGDGNGHDQVTRQGPPPGFDDAGPDGVDGDDAGSPGTGNGDG